MDGDLECTIPQPETDQEQESPIPRLHGRSKYPHSTSVSIRIGVSLAISEDQQQTDCIATSSSPRAPPKEEKSIKQKNMAQRFFVLPITPSNQ
jgi:hypothetical protein